MQLEFSHTTMQLEQQQCSENKAAINVVIIVNTDNNAVIIVNTDHPAIVAKNQQNHNLPLFLFENKAAQNGIKARGYLKQNGELASSPDISACLLSSASLMPLLFGSFKNSHFRLL